MILLIADDAVGDEDVVDAYSHVAGPVQPYLDAVRVPLCPGCGSSASLLVQVYAPTPSSADRLLYVFHCSSSPPCQPHHHIMAKSYCFRHSPTTADDAGGDSEPHHSEPGQSRNTSLIDDWGLDDTDHDIDGEIDRLIERQSADTCATGSRDVRMRRWDSTRIRLGRHRGVYLAEIDEPAKTRDRFDHELALLKQYELEQDEKRVDGSGGDDDRFEEWGDVAFTRFHKRLSREPRQCIRYGPGQQPLLMRQYADDTGLVVPPCSHCGADRVLEMQVMPNLINVLSLSASSHTWGTISVYTCPKHCTKHQLVDEFVFIEDGF